MARKVKAKSRAVKLGGLAMKLKAKAKAKAQAASAGSASANDVASGSAAAPAAAPDAALLSSVARKRVHSKAYHLEATLAKKAGCSKEEISHRACLAAHRAVEQWSADNH